MQCVICKQAEVQSGKTTITLERGDLTLVVKGVPARICPNCGEEYVNEEITGQLLNMAEEVANAGVQVDIREYVAA